MSAREPFDFAVFLCGDLSAPLVFVVPSSETRKHVYIPATPPTGYNGITGRLNFWRDYRDAWPR